MISGRDGQDGMGRFAAWFERHETSIDRAIRQVWVGKQYDCAFAMIYNEVMIAQAQAKEECFVDNKRFGIDWSENATFTSEDFLKKYPNEVKKFEVEKFVATRYQVYKTV
jgi:hypothetical protein